MLIKLIMLSTAQRSAAEKKVANYIELGELIIGWIVNDND